MATVEAPEITPDDLLRMEDAGHYELIDGCLVERNVSTDSSRIAVRITLQLAQHIIHTGLGEVYDSELGIRAFPDYPGRVRRADVSFVRAENVPQQSSGYLRVMPDLIVEVVSPGDALEDVRAKVGMWLEAGARLVWVVTPGAREVLVYGTGRTPIILTEGEEIDGEDVIPGFRCPVASFFPAPLPAAPQPGQP